MYNNWETDNFNIIVENSTTQVFPPRRTKMIRIKCTSNCSLSVTEEGASGGFPLTADTVVDLPISGVGGVVFNREGANAPEEGWVGFYIYGSSGTVYLTYFKD